MDAFEVIDSNINDVFQTIRCRKKKKHDKNTIVYFLCKS